MNKDKEVESYLKGELPEEEKLNMRSPENWDFWTRCWKMDGKAFRQRKPGGLAD